MFQSSPDPKAGRNGVDDTPLCWPVLGGICANGVFSLLKTVYREWIFSRNFRFAGVMDLRGSAGVLGVAGGSRSSLSEDQRVLEGDVAVLAVAFDVLFTGRVEPVDAEAILVFGDDAEQPGTEAFELRIVYPALEDGVLDALAVVLAGGGDVAQASPPGFRFRVYVVGYEDVHRLSRGEGDVDFRVAAQVTGEQAGLNVRHEP